MHAGAEKFLGTGALRQITVAEPGFDRLEQRRQDRHETRLGAKKKSMDVRPRRSYESIFGAYPTKHANFRSRGAILVLRSL